MWFNMDYNDHTCREHSWEVKIPACLPTFPMAMSCKADGLKSLDIIYYPY